MISPQEKQGSGKRTLTSELLSPNRLSHLHHVCEGSMRTSDAVDVIGRQWEGLHDPQDLAQDHAVLPAQVAPDGLNTAEGFGRRWK